MNQSKCLIDGLLHNLLPISSLFLQGRLHSLLSLDHVSLHLFLQSFFSARCLSLQFLDLICMVALQELQLVGEVLIQSTVLLLDLFLFLL